MNKPGLVARLNIGTKYGVLKVDVGRDYMPRESLWVAFEKEGKCGPAVTEVLTALNDKTGGLTAVDGEIAILTTFRAIADLEEYLRDRGFKCTRAC